MIYTPNLSIPIYTCSFIHLTYLFLNLCFHCVMSPFPQTCNKVALRAVNSMLNDPNKRQGCLLKMDYYPEGPVHSYLYGVVKYFFSLTISEEKLFFACVEWLNTLKGDTFDHRLDADGNIYFPMDNALYKGMAVQIVNFKDISPTGGFTRIIFLNFCPALTSNCLSSCRSGFSAR